MANDSNGPHLSTPRATRTSQTPEEISGPVPIQHRNRLGQDITSNPQGVGKPSTASKIQKGSGGCTW